MKLLIAILSLLLRSTASSPLLPRQATNGPHPPTILWSCLGNPDPLLNIPSVCSNMCYGAYCRGYGTTLTWNTSLGIPVGWTELFRRFNAGCYFGVNDILTEFWDQEDRCQRVGMACSVYPFETASEGDVNVRRGGPVSRCVDIGEDARQAAMLNLLYNSSGPWSDSQGLNSSIQATQFHQVFANAGEIPYCSGLPSDCMTDGAEFDRQGTIFTYDPLPGQQKQRRYRLSGGTDFTLMQEMEIGRTVLLPKVRDRERFMQLSESLDLKREKMLERLGDLLYLDVEEVEEEVFETSV